MNPTAYKKCKKVGKLLVSHLLFILPLPGRAYNITKLQMKGTTLNFAPTVFDDSSCWQQQTAE